jgi:hypothetical protein
LSALALLTTAGVVTWTEGRAMTMGDIYELVSILQEWDQTRKRG